MPKPTELRPNYYRVPVRVGVIPSTDREHLVLMELECFDLIDALQLGYYAGNALKYLFRAGRKHCEGKSSVLDIRKSFTFLQQAIERKEIR